MDIALLNRKVTVQKNTVVVDDIGNHVSKWDDFYSCYATISGESPNESTSVGTVVDNTKADFSVRWCKAVSEVTPDGYRVDVYKRQLQYKGIRTGKRRTVTAFAYIMHEDRPVGVPSNFYMRTCLEGYDTFRFDKNVLVDARCV